MKNKIAILFVCWLLVASVLPVMESKEGDLHTKEIEKSISFSKPDIQELEKSQYVCINVEESTSYYMCPGKPILPIYTEVFTFPFGTNITDIICQSSDIQSKTISRKIVQCPEPLSANSANNAFRKILKNKIECQSTNFFPNMWYSYRTGTGLDGDERVVFLTVGIYPVRYSPSQDIVQFTDKVDIKIEYESPSKPVMFPKKCDMIIISPGDFSDELQPLIDFKNSSRVTQLFTLDQIPAVGRDKQEDIKYFIKQAIEELGITSVLLVGGNNEVPCRMAYVDEIRAIVMDEKCFISDLYYADIYDSAGDFSSWDTNGNDLFGEYNLWESNPADEVDLYPDVYIGRLACTNESQVTTCVNKIITYETEEAYMQDWFTNLVLIGGDTFTEDAAGISEGECTTQAIADVMKDFNAEKIWGSNGRLYRAKNITDAIEIGAGFVSFEGHSGSNSYRTHPYKSRNKWIPIEWYRTYHIESLSNGDMLPIVTINGCNTCKFSASHTCLGWGFIANSHGGGIATIGMTSLSWIYPGQFCTKGLGGLIHLNCYKTYSQQEAKTFGEMWGKSINEYLNLHPWRMSIYDYKTIESWESLGDPSLYISSSNKPNKPMIDGTKLGRPGIEYEYSLVTTDPDGDNVFYYVEWGDDSVDGWAGPYESGVSITVSHVWDEQDTYVIRAKSKDTYNVESDSAELELVMVKQKTSNFFLIPLLERLIERFPLLKHLSNV